MALSNTMPNVKMFQDSTGKYIPLRIQWNETTRAWHVHDNRGTLHRVRATIIPRLTGYLMQVREWEYDPSHPEHLNFNKMPAIKHSKHTHLTSALMVFGLMHE